MSELTFTFHEILSYLLHRQSLPLVFQVSRLYHSGSSVNQTSTLRALTGVLARVFKLRIANHEFSERQAT